MVKKNKKIKTLPNDFFFKEMVFDHLKKTQMGLT